MLYTTASGFGKAGAWHLFLQRRVVRIVPLYWLFTLGVFAAHASGYLYQHQSWTVYNVITSLFFIGNIKPIIYVGWTLNYEMYFYVIFTICLLVLKSPRWVVPMVAAILFVNLSLLSRCVGHGIGPFLANPNAFEFVMGMLLAIGWRKAENSTLRTLTHRRRRGSSNLFGVCFGSCFTMSMVSMGAFRQR